MMTIEQKENTLKFLVSKYNFLAGERIKSSGDGNRNKGLAVIEAIEASGYNIQNFIDFMKGQVERGNRFQTICDLYIEKLDSDRRAEQQEQAKAQAQQAQAFTEQTALNFLGSVVTNMLSNMKLDEIKAQVSTALQDDVRKFIADTYGPIQRKVEIHIDDRKVEMQGVLHSKFDTVLKFVRMNEPVFLTGPAGSGKNVICQQVAKTLGLDFYFSNAVTQEYKLTGFTDANGTFHESQFYKAFKNGGVFMLDEMDASIPEVLIILNAAIANRYFDFPAPIGYTEAHKDFRVIAAGNTFGNGADYDYVGRSQLDAASLDRFAMIRIDYVSRIEEACAMGDSELLGFCRAFRKATQKAGVRTVVSYRAISRMAKLSQCMDADEVLDTCLIKSLEVDDLKVMENDLRGYGKYTEGYRKVMRERKSA